MRLKRKLAKNVWYKVRTELNISEPLFQLGWAMVLFYRVLFETRLLFRFEIRGLNIEDGTLSFFIKPADGLKLPKIMQWMKQTFSVRFNFRTGRKGHVWGDRYWSEILDGEPPPEAKEMDWAAMFAEANKPVPAAMTYTLTWDSLMSGVWEAKTSFSPKNPPDPVSPPG